MTANESRRATLRFTIIGCLISLLLIAALLFIPVGCRVQNIYGSCPHCDGEHGPGMEGIAVGTGENTARLRSGCGTFIYAPYSAEKETRVETQIDADATLTD